MANYDYIILGAGAAGLMLARAMAEDVWFKSHSILIIDKDSKNQNDRTWCYWENGEGKYDHLLTNQWDNIFFRGKGLDKKLDISPYSYKMLRSSDFYRENLEVIENASHIEFLKAEVKKIENEDGAIRVITDSSNVTGSYVFDSFFEYHELHGQHYFPVLQQHFVGWFIESSAPVFDAGAATFMDFSIAQKGNTRFMYVLPFNERVALVEYTLFSSETLELNEYEEAIEHYLAYHYGLREYKILEKEKGNIPMTCYDFEAQNTDRHIHIGTAGGWAKPSTGFTFRNSMKNTRALIAHIKKGKALKDFSVKKRYWYYDLLLLDILAEQNEIGSRIFTSMFKNSRPQLILKFLDEQSTLLEDLWVILSCPFRPFIRAFFKRLFKGKS